ncbi:glycosyltransferase family 87 protein [Isosphaeraceae bacterium EP7]
MPPVPTATTPLPVPDQPAADLKVRRGIRVTVFVILAVAAVLYAGKAADDRSAFIRWRPQVLELMAGHNIYDTTLYPNPPIMAISLAPLAAMNPVVGAVLFFMIKVGLAALSFRLLLKMAVPEGRRISPWIEGAILLLTLRPILSDLHHGNNNLIIMALIVLALASWRRGWDVRAGLALGLAITYKVTPALFVPYFLYKKSWRAAGATMLSMALFFFVVPSAVLGPHLNMQCLASWWHRILSPYLVDGNIGKGDINQSMVGVLSRLLTDSVGPDRYDSKIPVNFVAWDPAMVARLAKVSSLGFVAVLALLCRTKAVRRVDPRMLGEFSLVVLTMLFVSERSWKHHYVTLLLPMTYLACRVGMPSLPKATRWGLASLLGLATLLMASTSSELGGLFLGGQGHKIAQAYGMFLWAGIAVYVGVAWRVLAERNESPFVEDQAPSPAPTTAGARTPHMAGARARSIGAR